MDAAGSPSMEGFKTQLDEALRRLCLSQGVGGETSKGLFPPKSLCGPMKPGFIRNCADGATYSAHQGKYLTSG